MDALAHLAGIAASVIGATWYLGQKIAKLEESIKPVKEEVDRLRGLPERVARLEEAVR